MIREGFERGVRGARSYLNVTMCTIAHALEKTKCAPADVSLCLFACARHLV